MSENTAQETNNTNAPTQQASQQQVQWQQQTIEKLAMSGLKEQQTARKWNTFFKILFFGYLLTLLMMGLGWIGGGKATSGDHTALIEVAGEIGAGGEVNADSFMSSLNDAYDDKGTKGIILRFNTPGGSPVQAGIINDEITRQKKLHPTIPVIGVVEDMCASAGYYIASATDKIYVDKASIVGSIGVLMDGYGFTGTMEKLGVERRLMTAGENKAMLDPFSPVNEKHKAYAQTLINEVHEQFKSVVRKGRGNRLKEKETPEIFSGLFWSGEQSIKIGLADGFGSADYVAREVIKQEEIVDYTYQETFADRFAKRLGASIANSVGIDAKNNHFKLK
jgi:protease IV